MRIAGSRRRLFRLAFLPLVVVLALVSVAAVAVPPATTQASPPSGPAPVAPLPIPRDFRVQATNGYTLEMVGEPPRKGTSGSLLLIASAEGRQVTYKAPATVTETSIQADLGALGEISVNFQRSDRATSAPCDKTKVRFDSGSWVGTITFHGEDGYTSAEATSAPGDVDWSLGGFCGPGFNSGSSGPRRGAELFVRNPGLGPQLTVYSHRPGAAALIYVHVSEYIDGISIERMTSAWIPGRDFAYDQRLRTATVAPPAPFSGAARFDLARTAGRRWSGDLTVEMPGRADVPLTGASLRATLSPSG
jgi:hypothetical protein